MKGTYLEVLENHDNIAPIMDAVLADIDRSGQVSTMQSRPCSYPHSLTRIIASGCNVLW